MDRKLAEFRARRRREEIVNKTKDTINNLLSMSFVRNEATSEAQEPLIPASERIVPRSLQRSPPESITSDDVSEVEEATEEEPEDDEKGRWLRRTNLALMFLLWFTLLCVALQLQLALAYSLISALVFIFLNTGTRPRRPGEPSAYSVFNPNCEEIDGTLNAEQFEREIRYGPASVR
ncbi:hypothetical protein B566_EDAN001649 [Ephemera danica]|nr:hypothetical protein B566_EDAN001649 [Ephemera danica]